jgi:hypothetical protein
MSELSATHPENHLVATAMRAVDCVSEVQWCYDRRYKVWFTSDATAVQIETFLAKLETECGFRPSVTHVPGNNIVVDAETVPIEIEDDTEVTSDE